MRTIIGLEVHVQLATQTKLFCGCTTLFRPDEPNTQTCPVCLGLPGALPVMNRRAFELATRVGAALGCDLSPFTKWDRKQYYYPDLPKAYQISQYDLPFSHDGLFELSIDPESEERFPVRIIRAHLEEDAGKNNHTTGGRGDSRVDLNRCGTPLVEIVTQPDLSSGTQARRFVEELRLLLLDLGVSDCNMQEGNLRCDVNLNLEIDQPDGSRVRTPVTEIKNLNSFRNIEAACEAETRRQVAEFEATGRKFGDPGVTKITCGFDPDTETTFIQRDKEDASDYRYFPDPDLLPVTLTDERIQEIHEELPEFPADRRARFQVAYNLSAYDATVIVDQGCAFADYFERVAKECSDGKLAANWVTQDVLREQNERGIDIEAFPITAPVLGRLLHRIHDSAITNKSGRELFAELLGGTTEPDRVDELIAERGLEVVNDDATLDPIIDAVIARNERIVADVRGGKQAAVGPLIGQVMGQVKGADPKSVRQRILDRIAETH